DWFGPLSVASQDGVAGSTLELYRRALAVRRELQTEEDLQWLEVAGEQVLACRRPNGWTCVTNFGTEPVELPTDETVVINSGPLDERWLPGEPTVWPRG